MDLHAKDAVWLSVLADEIAYEPQIDTPYLIYAFNIYFPISHIPKQLNLET